jgi:hypothetical protein
MFREDVYEAVAMNVIRFRIFIAELGTWAARKRMRTEAVRLLDLCQGSRFNQRQNIR